MTSSGKLPISVVIIAKNEETRIADCLKSVDWSDDIIVLDDYSTDKTAEVCRQFTDRVYQRMMDFEGKHRNYAYTLPRNEWIFSIDADERVSEGLKHEITNLHAQGMDCNGYTIPRRNYMGDYWVRHGGLYPAAQMRLFRKNSFRFDEQAEVHPPVSYYLPGKWGTLKNDIIHYTYRDFTDAIGKLDRQTDLEARKWFRENRRVGVFGTMRKTLDRFCRSYFSKQGYKDGVIGLFLAVNSGMYQFLTYAKYWEMKRVAGGKR